MLGHLCIETTEKLYTEVLEERIIKESANSTIFLSSMTFNYKQKTLFDNNLKV